MFADLLRSEGFETLEAENGERAIERYERDAPDLVLLDILMPGLDGLEVCRRLRSRHGSETAPVIFITGRGEPEGVVNALTAGGVDYLSKPFGSREVLVRIRTHLRMRLLLLEQRRLVEQLERADAAKNRLLGMVVHDLRNPLASIRGLAEILRETAGDSLNADHLDLVETIHTVSEDTLALVNRLLDAAAIEAGELQITLKPVDLKGVVEEAARLAGREAARKNSRIELEMGGLREPVRIDSRRIGHMIASLLDNAVRYSPAGSIIRVQAGERENGCFIAVHDQGPGLPEEERRRLAQNASQTPFEVVQGKKTLGLGLAICRKTVTAHRGAITAENPPGGGCVVRVTLPHQTS